MIRDRRVEELHRGLMDQLLLLDEAFTSSIMWRKGLRPILFIVLILPELILFFDIFLLETLHKLRMDINERIQVHKCSVLEFFRSDAEFRALLKHRFVKFADEFIHIRDVLQLRAF